MENLLYKTLLKSLLLLSVTLTGLWNQPKLLGHDSNLLQQSPQSSFETSAINGYPGPSNAESDGLFDSLLPAGLKISSQIEAVVYCSYIWFMVLMITLKMIFLTRSAFKQAQAMLSSDESCSDKLPQAFASKLKKFIVYLLKSVLLYSLCYFIIMSIFVGFYFACNIYTNTQKGLFQSGMPFTEQKGRDLQEIYPNITLDESEQTKTGGERFLKGLSSTAYETVFQTQMTIGSIVLSSDNQTAFLARLDTAPNCVLEIIDISTPSSPTFLGNISFAMTYTNQYPWGESLALSSDEQLMIMAVGSTLELIDVSNLTSPVSISSFPLAQNESIQSVLLSSDSNTVFLVTCVASTPDQYFVKVLNITESQSPQFIMTLTENKYQIQIFISQESMAVVKNTTILIYDISDIQNIFLESDMLFGDYSQNSFPIQFVSDLQIAYFIGQFYGVLSSYNTSRQSGAILEIDEDKSLTNLFVASDNKLLVVIATTYFQIFDISAPTSPILLATMGFSSFNCISISADEQTALVSAADSFYIIQLDLKLQPEQVVSTLTIFFDNILGYPAGDCMSFFSSPDGKTLLCFNGDSAFIMDISSSSIASRALNFPYTSHFIWMALSPNGEVLLGISTAPQSPSTNFTLLNSTDGQVLSLFTFNNSGYYDEEFLQQNFQSVVITPDSRTALVIQSFTNFLIFNISDPYNLSVLSNTSYSALNAATVALSSDGQTVFIAGPIMDNTSPLTPSSLRIYDISAPSSPKLISEFNKLLGLITSMILSPDGSVAYVLSDPIDQVGVGFQGTCSLSIIDVSLLDAPVLIAPMNLADSCTTTLIGPLFSATPDIQVLVITLENFLVYVDVSNLTSPKLMDSYYYDFYVTGIYEIIGVAACSDFNTLYTVVNDYNGEYSLINTSLLPTNVLFLPSNTFSLGSSYASTLNVLTLDSNGEYDSSTFDYKFTNLGFYNPALTYSQERQITSLPSWVSFDESNGVIAFSPSSSSPIGSYYLCGILSPQISTAAFISAYYAYNNTFENLQPINETEVLTLLLNLAELGYIDNEFYITPSFDLSDWGAFTQNQSQSMLQGTSDQIQLGVVGSALNSLLINVLTTVNITSSLALTFSDSIPSSSPSSSSPSISITTLSLQPLTVAITLEAQSTQPQFVTTTSFFTASSSNNNSQVNWVSSLIDANTALSHLVIFLNGSDYCNGTISVTDGLNPTLNQPVFNISSYFVRSSQPWVNTSYFRTQLAKVYPKTGDQFSFQFDPSTFSDPTSQPLTFQLQMQDNNLQVPDWLELKNYVLTGTPPDQITGRELSLKMIVSNQYQSTEIDFSIDIGISLEYALKMIGTYGGALITLIGLWVYATDIYNILCKKRYRYPKDFVIRVGQEVDKKIMYPIPFLQQPLLESKIIISQLENNAMKQLNDNSQFSVVSYFTTANSWNLDKAKLLKSIKNTVADIQKKDKTKLKLYTSKHQELINQLILNYFTLRLLEIAENKPTKTAFELIKADLFSIVELNSHLPNGLCKFSLNKTNLHLKLKACNIRVYTPSGEEENSANQSILSSRNDSSMINVTLESPHIQTKKSIETELVSSDSETNKRLSSSVNIDLLVKVIEAYALIQHVVDADIVKVDVVIRERLDKIWLENMRRFLKLDLKLTGFSGKTLIGYGIEYQVQENSLIFCGTANHNIKDKTLIVQIVSKGGQILRELWLYGVEVEEEKGSPSLAQEVL